MTAHEDMAAEEFESWECPSTTVDPFPRPRPQPTMFVVSGLPASGKTTRAFEIMAESTTPTAHVCRDDIRKVMFNDYVLDQDCELVVFSVERKMIRAALSRCYNVVVDAINLDSSSRRRLRQLAEESNANIVFELLRVPVAECLRRNQERWERDGERLVPTEKIVELATRFASNLKG